MNITMIIAGIFGGQEIIFVLLIIVVIFGASRIPQIMKGLGQGINEFKKAKDGVMNELENEPKNNDQSGKNQSKS